jgi:hypothetical protein
MNFAKIGVSTMEGDTMPQDTGPKRQVNVYFPEDTHLELQSLTLERKRTDRSYSVTQLVNDAVSLYLMVLRYHRESRSTQSVYDFTLGALKTFLDSSRSRKT